MAELYWSVVAQSVYVWTLVGAASVLVRIVWMLAEALWVLVEALLEVVGAV